MRFLVRSFVLVVALIACMASSMGMFGGKPAQIVPASQAPPPPAGHGWYCFDYQIAITNDRDANVQHDSGDYCERTLGECQEQTHVMASSSKGNRNYTPGSCVSQPSATCTYAWGDGDGKFYCYRSPTTCGPRQGALAQKQSECTDYL